MELRNRVAELVAPKELPPAEKMELVFGGAVAKRNDHIVAHYTTQVELGRMRLSVAADHAAKDIRGERGYVKGVKPLVKEEPAVELTVFELVVDE